MSRLPSDLERLLHDLRGPLNGLAMHAEVLKRAVDDPVGADSVRSIQQEVERLAAMLAAAMQVMALEPGPRERVGLRAVVEQALDEGRLKDVTLAGDDWPEVMGDRALLTVAAGHLISNAVEATQAAGPGAPPPEVSAARVSGGMASLHVRDHGLGLRSTNPKIVIRLRASPKPGHEGVGLITVERIVRLHGGRLTFEKMEEPARGTRVSLTIPAAR